MNRCPACDEITESLLDSSGVIYENAHWMVSHKTGDGVIAGNLIIKAKRHCEHLAELTKQESTSLGEIIQKTCLALSKVIEVQKIYVASFGEGIKHVHFFIVPRTRSMPSGNLKVFLYQRLHSFLVKYNFKRKFTSEEKRNLITTLREEYKNDENFSGNA